MPVDQEGPSLEIFSLRSGSVLYPEDTFEITLDFDDEEIMPDRLVIDLLDSEGEILFSVELDSEQILQLPLPVELPADIVDGTYEVVITVFQEGEEIGSESSLFFLIQEEFIIDAINAYPQFFYPGGLGLVYADLSIPDEADPDLRWLGGDEVLLEGLLSEGADELQLQVPDREGVYSIRLEVFPFSPADESIFDFISEISLEAQFFVSSTQDVDEAEFSPEENYYSLFHFRGEFVDWGSRVGEAAVSIGIVDLAIAQGLFGFYFDGSNGFSAEEVLLPIVEGVIHPFSFSVRLAPFSQTGTLISMFDRTGAVVFSVGFDDEERLSASLNGSQTAAEYDFESGVPVDLTLSVIPSEDSVLFLWFVDGIMLSAEEQIFEPVDFENLGMTYIGGENSAKAVIDEIGIFYKVTELGVETDSEVYERAMVRLYGEDLIYAEGFDGQHIPETLSYSENQNLYLVEGGSLILLPEAGIEYYELPEIFDSLSFTIDKVGLGVITLRGDETGDIYYDSSSAAGTTEEGEENESDDDDTLLLEVVSRDGRLYSEQDGDTGDLGFVDEELTLTVVNDGEEDSVEIRSILIVKDHWELK
ncbi:MAG: hypothetical protein HN368_05985 [Spirochaetales bacterium]|nr:hypothetical protein [Spirochaetales bacterium]